MTWDKHPRKLANDKASVFVLTSIELLCLCWQGELMKEHLFYEEQYNKIETLLDSDRVPQEVWIGTDSVADRVQWLITRKNHLDKRAKHRFEMIENLVFACNEALKHVRSENAFLGIKQSGLEDEAGCLEGLLTEALEFCNPMANSILNMQKAETNRLAQRAMLAETEKA